MTLDEYLAINHVPIYGSILISRLTGSCHVVRSFRPIEPGGDNQSFCVGSGTDPIAVVQLPPAGAYMVGVKEGSPFPLAICLRTQDHEELPRGDRLPHGPIFSAGKLLHHALRSDLGLTATIFGMAQQEKSGQ